MSRQSSPARKPSSNWVALRKNLRSAYVESDSKAYSSLPPKKKRKTQHESEDASEVSFQRGTAVISAPGSNLSESPMSVQHDADETHPGGDSKSALRKMISGQINHLPSHLEPGKYIALDCEMVGVGPEGKESSLARVSIVNYYGAVLLDVYVKQRERVVDYRTQFSGVRPRDLVNAKPFPKVQQEVADLLKDRFLIGHAVHHDFKALLLSHPHHQTRDTQIYAHKHGLVRTKRIALRVLVQKELGVAIQTGEHSSVTDARATMAVYRLHRQSWEKSAPHHPSASRPSTSTLPSPASTSRSRKSSWPASLSPSDSAPTLPSSQSLPRTARLSGGGRKGVSSGLSTVVHVTTKKNEKESASTSAGVRLGGKGRTTKEAGKQKRDKWWETLG